MAVHNTTSSTTVPSSTLIATSAFATGPTQGVIDVVGHENASSYSSGLSYLGSENFNSLGGQRSKVPWTTQEALYFGGPDIFGDTQAFKLTSTGCLVGEGPDQRRNCSEVCTTQPDKLFSDTSNLANCMALPPLADLYASGNLSETSKNIANMYGIGPSSSIALNVSSTLSNCFTAYCKQSSRCIDNYAWYFEGNTTYYNRGSVICYSAEGTVLGDISGIGIYVSYWLQSSIAIVAWVLLMVYANFIFYMSFLALIWPRGQSEALSIARSMRKKTRERALPRLAAALVEFQKAQCYFMIAVQIAAVFTLSEGRLQPASLQQLYNNWEAVRVISISGSLPVTFILLALQSIGKKSWYLMLLSTVTVIISLASLVVTGAFLPSENDMTYLQSQTSKITECGNRNPTTYCLSRYFDITALGSHSPNLIFAFTIIILLLLYIDLLKYQLLSIYQQHKLRLPRVDIAGIVRSLTARPWLVISVSGQRLSNHLQANATFRKWMHNHYMLHFRKLLTGFAENVRRDWRRIITNILYLIAWSLYLMFFVDLMKNLQVFLDFGMVNFTWSFGQIVGITVWAEPLVEYFYLETKGMTAANYRFLEPWVLTRLDESGEANDKAPLRPSEYTLVPVKERSPERVPTTGSTYSVQRNGSSGNSEGQHQTDVMAQHLL